MTKNSCNLRDEYYLIVKQLHLYRQFEQLWGGEVLVRRRMGGRGKGKGGGRWVRYNTDYTVEAGNDRCGVSLKLKNFNSCITISKLISSGSITNELTKAENGSEIWCKCDFLKAFIHVILLALLVLRRAFHTFEATWNQIQQASINVLPDMRILHDESTSTMCIRQSSTFRITNDGPLRHVEANSMMWGEACI